MTSPSVDEVLFLVPALALGVAAAVVDVTYRPLRHVVTAVHEAGHAVVALACGRRLRAIRLNRDSSGETVSVGRAGGFGVVLTLLAGYPAPGLVGLAGVWSVAQAQARWWVLGLLVLLCGVMLMLRNLFGFVVLALCVGVLFVLARDGASSAAPVVLGASAFLLVAGVRGSLELRRASASMDDARALAQVTRTGRFLWFTFFVLVAGITAGLGAWLVLFRLGVLSPG